MRRGSAGLIAAVLALAGCKGVGTKPVEKGRGKDKEPAGITTARDKGKLPAWLDESVTRGTTVPPASTWAKPGDRRFDARAEARRLLAGKVFDPSGRAVKGAFIRIDPADAPPGDKGAPIGILTRDDGSFMTQTLEPNRTYTLRVSATAEGRTLAAEVQTRIPNSTLTISLREDLNLPGLPPAGGASGGTGLPPRSAAPAVPPGEIPPPNNDLIAPPAVPAAPSAERGWGPDSGSGNRSIPPSLSNPGTPPVPGSDPARTPGTPPSRTVRPENFADGPKDPFKPPSLSLPPPVTPAPVAPFPPTPKPNRKSSRPVKAGANFALVDTLERDWEFATNRYEPLVLVNFMTTTCVPCRRAAPVLADIQAQFAAAGLQLLGVVCDDGSLKNRAALAAKYHQEHNLNYALYVEPRPGQVQRRFHVEGYPTAVLLDETGSVLWKGHPQQDRGGLEAAIRHHLAK